ncbi:hypothetical protein SAMN05421690_10759 [Nitrosomonas sp. Nm51]|uniref:hypothetical protein n=1 Tax=Nitrosomonas sp. Nm51 TaxID=133720 RepID=UPI0008AB7B6F|nr:hypothetical protein [Nitrosomonas sp. Nm51]SER78204.1 hypothetical protein SAMN05421690_10759 [Nitrosomonas sp. Nm51]
MNVRNQRTIKRVFIPVLGFILLLSGLTATVNTNSSNRSDSLLRAVEISGVSITMPQEEVADILDKQGYTQVNSTLFTKQEQLDGRRKTIFRIEIENTADFRQITYHRSLSGGRVKSSVEEKPIPAFELDTVQQLYQIVCENVPETVKAERSCEPAAQAGIHAGHGKFIAIDDHWAVQLSATASNSAIGIKFFTYE